MSLDKFVVAPALRRHPARSESARVVDALLVRAGSEPGWGAMNQTGAIIRAVRRHLRRARTTTSP